MKKKVWIKSTVMAITLSAALAGIAPVPGTNATTTPSLAEYYGEFNLASSKSVKVIVQLKEESLAEAKQKGKNQTKANLAKVRNSVKAEVNQKIKSSKTGREYDTVFSGFALELPENEINNLLTIPGIKAVYPDVTYTVTGEEVVPVDPESYYPNMLDSAPFIGANKAWETGYTGEGITVAVIDTGADYNHPDLKDAYSGDYKGWDFVDNDNDPMETPVGDPRGASTNHGSHVSGTVAANGLIKGVAPDANLLAYRVLGPGGRGTTANVIAGIEKAVQDGADVMNLSLGASVNNPDYATSIALDWAMAEGVVAVTSNGNSGPNNWTVGSPGTSRSAISVGASALPYDYYVGTVKTGNVSYDSAKVMGFPSVEAIKGLNGKQLEVVNVGLGGVADFSGKDVAGKVALIQRGAYAFVDKVQNAKNAGAVAAVIWNNPGNTTAIPDIAGLALPTFKLVQADGEKFVAEVQAGNNKADFTAAFGRRIGETMADFSSRGPVNGTWMIKPDVSAPGVNITSTVPTHNAAAPHGYASMQGTSMASPHVAGAAALILDAHPEYTVQDVKAALMNTAENLFDENGVEYPLNTQGAGSIRVADAINSKTLVTPGSHSFGIFENLEEKEVRKTKVTVKNLSGSAKNYSLKVQFKGNPEGIKVSTSSNNRVLAGKTQDINFSVQVDASKLTKVFYEGTIYVSDGEKTYEVPTILFSKDLDYARIMDLSVAAKGDGTYIVSSNLPNGADELYFLVYRLTDPTTGAVVLAGQGSVHNNLPKGINDLAWDGNVLSSTGTVSHVTSLTPGTYYLRGVATKAGKTTAVWSSNTINVK